MRRPLVVGNWKMNGTAAAGARLAAEVATLVDPDAGAVEVAVAPPFTALLAVAQAVSGTAVAVAAQDLYWEAAGPYTGAVSPLMVAEFATYAIVGHSERRSLFGETDGNVNRKMHAAFRHGLTPIVCVGETLMEREAGNTDSIVELQLAVGLEGIAHTEAGRLVVAYEPVWAIGTGRPCHPGEAQRVIGGIRSWLAATCGDGAAAGARLLYGGSAQAENAGGYFAMPDIDGALVGGASLNADSFSAIVRAAR